MNCWRILSFALLVLATVGKATGEESKATVFYAFEPSSLTPGREARPEVVRAMVNRLVCAATGQSNPASAWASLVSPGDRVGIKVSAGGGRVSGTRPAVVEAIAAGLREAGVPASRIVVWDRQRQDLLDAGFDPSSPSYRLRWVEGAGGYDPQSRVTAPVLGRLIWGDSGFGRREGTRMEDILAGGEQVSSTSHYAQILSRDVDKVINVPSLMDSFHTGIHGALANMTLPNLDNWRRFTRAPDHGDPYLAEIYGDGMIRDKVVLTILDALLLQYAGGPFPNPACTVECHSIFVSRDPVAIDATAARLIDEFRIPAKLPSVEKSTRWLEAAESLGLGQSREPAFSLLRIGGRPRAGSH